MNILMTGVIVKMEPYNFGFASKPMVQVDLEVSEDSTSYDRSIASVQLRIPREKAKGLLYGQKVSVAISAATVRSSEEVVIDCGGAVEKAE
jgi:hypothetical protein